MASACRPYPAPFRGSARRQRAARDFTEDFTKPFTKDFIEDITKDFAMDHPLSRLHPPHPALPADGQLVGGRQQWV